MKNEVKDNLIKIENSEVNDIVLGQKGDNIIQNITKNLFQTIIQQQN